MSQSVFISYCRDDDEPFAKRLHEDLTRTGFEVWWDRVSMPSRQLTFYQEIADAIRSHDRLILIVGPKDAVSTSVRHEWQWALGLDKPIIPILRKGDYTLLPGELSGLQCDDFRDDAQYRIQVAKLVENLRRPEPPLGGLFGVPSLPPHFLARPDLLCQVKDALLADLKRPLVITASDARVGIHGMGGIGKSVLAAAIAHDREVRRSYPDGIIWLTIGQQPNLVRLQHEIARHLGSKEHFDTEPQGRGVLRQLLAQKAVLLVLDDVWQTSDAQAFDVLGPRCRALVTTRDAGILHTLGGLSVPVALLTEEQALQLLADAVGVESSALPSEALEVVKECGYLPLAVALCGSMVKKHGGDWIATLERLQSADIEKIADLHTIDERHQSIWRTMQVSVDALPSEEQRRFAELSVFTRDNPVPEAAVATLWSHTGNLSDLDTTDILINLADRSLICLHQKPAAPGEPIERYISLHDLLYDFATRLAGEGQALNKVLLAAYRKRCTHGWPTGPNDGYFYQHLAHHLRAAGRQGELNKLLFDYRWLRSKLNATDSNALMADYDLIDDDPQARLIQGAIRLSSDTLTGDASHLPSQLYGRLPSQKGMNIKALLTGLVRDEEGAWLRPLAATLTPPGGPLLRTLRGHEDSVWAVAVTPDGRYAISGSDDRTLKVWNLASGQVVHTLRGHAGRVTAAAVTGDGRYTVSSSFDQTLKVWNLASSQVVHTLRGHKDRVLSVAVTPDGRYAVSGSRDGTLKVWDLASGKALRTLRCRHWWGHLVGVETVAVTPDGRYVLSGSDDGRVKVWSLESGKELRDFTCHKWAVDTVAATPDGRHVVSSAWDDTVKVWDLQSGKVTREVRGHRSYVGGFVVTPDSRFVIASSGLMLWIWEIETGKEVQRLEEHTDSVYALAVTSDGRFAISGSRDKTLRVWDLQKAKVQRGHDRHRSAVLNVAMTFDGQYAISGSERTLKIWNLRSGKRIRSFEAKIGSVSPFAVVPGDRFVICGSSEWTVDLRSLKTGRILRSLEGQTGGTSSVAVTGDGRLAVCASPQWMVKVWDLETGREICTLKENSWVNGIAVTKDGRLAVCTLGGHQPEIGIWDLRTHRRWSSLRGHSSDVRDVAIVSDGGLAVSGSDDETLRVWDLQTSREVCVLRGHLGSVNAVAVTGDGQYAVSGSEDHTLKVWDLASGKVVASFCGDSAMLCCAVASDGRTIVAGEKSGRVHLLRLENVK